MFTNLTFDHHPKNVIYNDAIRTQAKSILKRNANELTQDDPCLTQQERKTFKDATIPLFHFNRLLPIMQYI